MYLSEPNEGGDPLPDYEGPSGHEPKTARRQINLPDSEMIMMADGYGR